jgi:outer membrane biogenesis lipoprotein LolB
MDRRASLSLALLPFVAACAVSPPTPPAAPPQDPSRWRGRFSASYPQAQAEGGLGRASGRFSLERGADGSVLLELANPIGQLIARARAGRDGAELQDSRGEVHRATDDESLTQALFGWRIPVRALPDWLSARTTGELSTGAADPARSGSPSSRGGEAGRWTVRVVRAEAGRAQVLELAFPAGEADPARRLSLRLVIDAAS